MVTGLKPRAQESKVNAGRSKGVTECPDYRQARTVSSTSPIALPS